MELYDYEIKHLDLIDKNLSECTLFLKRNKEFPIHKPCSVALFGKGARHTIKGGTGSGEVNSHFTITIEEGLKQAGFTITSDKWLDAYDAISEKAYESFAQKVRAEADHAHIPVIWYGMGQEMKEMEYELPLVKEGDIALYVLSRNSGEGKDREYVKGDYLLTDRETEDILYLNKTFKKFMLILNVGGPVDLEPIKSVENILLLSQLGADTGKVLPEILLGKANPSGKLATSWAYDPKMEFGNVDDTNYREGIYVGYRYYGSKHVNIDYPFGYGLSYTAFHIAYKSLNINKDIVTIEAIVTNTGNMEGKEVVQCYMTKPQGKLDQPYLSLCAFKKTDVIKPEATEMLSISFNMSDNASYDEMNQCWILEKGDYILHLGNSSIDIKPCAKIHIKEDIILGYSLNLNAPDFKDQVNENKLSFEGETYEYAYKPERAHFDYKETILDRVKAFDQDTLIRLCMGSFKMENDLIGVIGNASWSVAGAAGETADVEGLPKLVMADGPAGLRLTKNVAKDHLGLVPVNEKISKTFTRFLTKEEIKVFDSQIREPEKEAIYFDQYCTSLPIGTALAQSFNEDFVQLCGDIIGDEMERFNIDLWLAPALNIHRSVLCGRNFEYFSEDPYVSGKMAAVLIKGVQSHPGKGVTIKHFCANNQETNRYESNSTVSNRALREIYLKGFELCIKEAHPKALMTSYNLLNGIHTSEYKELMDILRNEYGFKGLIMTDWIIHSDSPKDPAGYKIINAGSNLIMPGSKEDYENVRSALDKGLISRETLEKRVSQLINVMEESVN